MKNWKDISDKEFDELFKKSSQLAKPELKDSYWLEFEARLEETEKSTFEKKDSFFKKRILIALLAMLLISGFLVTKNYWSKNHAVQGESNLPLVNQKNEGKPYIQEGGTESKHQLSEQNKLSNINNHNHKEGTTIDLNNKHRSFNQIKIPASNSASSPINSGQKIKTSKKVGTSNSLAQNYKSFDFKSKSSSRKVYSKMNNYEQAEYQEGIKNEVLKKDEVNLDNKTFLISLPSRLKGISFKTFYKENEFLKTPADYNREMAKINISKNKTFVNKIYFTAGVSPDFSKVINNSFLKMGYNWSAQLEYHFNERWSTQSGVIISEKFYSSTPNGIKWPTRWGTIPKELEGMEGSCKVVDIPLNVRYNIKYNDKSKMYVLGGVSSFILLNERYDYLYPEGFTFQGIKTKWARKEKEFLAVGMANFALGYERKVGDIFSLQIEPFVKIPTRDFGFTQVKLATTGVFITGKVRIK